MLLKVGRLHQKKKDKMSDDDITYDEQDKPLEDSNNVVDINEWAAMKYDKVREEDMKKMQEYEQNYILTG